MGKFNFNETPGKKVAAEIRDNHSVENVSQTIEGEKPMQAVVQPSPQVPQPTTASPVMVQSEPIPYNEVMKNVGAKIPYSIYDRLERIKRQSERSGVKADKRNIGDLVAQAIKEFVEKYDAVNA